jgi:hypothetical protein
LRVNASYPAPRAEANPGHVGWRQRFDRANGRVDQVMGGEPFRPSGKDRNRQRNPPIFIAFGAGKNGQSWR